MQKENPDSLPIAKYFVKAHLKVPRDGFLLEGKIAFKTIIAAEKFNEEILIKKFKYRKLEIKIQLIKIRFFDPFFP